MSDPGLFALIVGMTVVTVVARSFFFLSSRAWPLPAWAKRGLGYAPIAALAAVVLPEILILQGELVHGPDARIFGAVAGVAAFFWRRSVLATILAGMAVYLPLRLGLGW